MKTKKFSIILGACLILFFCSFSTASAGWVDGSIVGAEIYPTGVVKLSLEITGGGSFTISVDETLSSATISRLLAMALTAQTNLTPVSVYISGGRIIALKLLPT